jgi:hypothetical protein
LSLRSFTWIPLLALFLGATADAQRWTREQFLEFRDTIAVSPKHAERLLAQATTQTVLPVSTGYDQGGSGLCWCYATLNAIETNALVADPSSPIALSRAAMQTLNMEDRYLRRILGVEDNVWEGGTPVNAIDIMRRSGLFALADYHAAPAVANLKDPIPLTAVGVRALIAELYPSLDQVYGALPAQTHPVGGTGTIAPTELAKAVLGNAVWTAYGAPWSGTAPGWHTHYDPDARSGTLAYFLTEDQFSALIRTTLAGGHALTIDWGGHEEELYGAAFDEKGAPTLFFIKGSYGPSYTYQADVTALKRMVGLTTVATR